VNVEIGTYTYLDSVRFLASEIPFGDVIWIFEVMFWELQTRPRSKFWSLDIWESKVYTLVVCQRSSCQTGGVSAGFKVLNCWPFGADIILSLISLYYLLISYIRMRAGIVYLGCVIRTRKADLAGWEDDNEPFALCQRFENLLLVAAAILVFLLICYCLLPI